MLKCIDCGEKATRVFKAHINNKYNIFVCEWHSDNTIWESSHERYAPIRVAHFRDDGLPEIWEKEWTYLQMCEEGYCLVHPKAKVY